MMSNDVLSSELHLRQRSREQKNIQYLLLYILYIYICIMYLSISIYLSIYLYIYIYYDYTCLKIVGGVTEIKGQVEWLISGYIPFRPQRKAGLKLKGTSVDHHLHCRLHQERKTSESLVEGFPHKQSTPSSARFLNMQLM